MPHLVDVLDLVPQVDGFLQLGGAPRTGQDSSVIGVSALVRSLEVVWPFLLPRRQRIEER